MPRSVLLEGCELTARTPNPSTTAQHRRHWRPPQYTLLAAPGLQHANHVDGLVTLLRLDGTRCGWSLVLLPRGFSARASWLPVAILDASLVVVG